MLTRTVSQRFPRVQFWRRTAAFAIDFLAVWWISGLLSWILPFLPFFLAFLLTWLALRVLMAARHRGQSLGRYALDVTVIEVKFGKVPDLLTLTKRELIVGVAAWLAAIAFSQITRNPAALLLVIPLLVDCGMAANEGSRAAFHDLVAQTLVVGSLRGYSLDLKIKRLVAECTRYMK